MGKNVIISTLPNISQNYLPKVNTSNIFANSLVYDNGTNVMVNTTATHADYTNARLVVNNTGNSYLEVRGNGGQGTIALTTSTSTTSNFPTVEIFNSADFGIVGYRPGVVSSNYIMYYELSSSTNRRLTFQTEGVTRLAINQDGTSVFSSSVTANNNLTGTRTGISTQDSTGYGVGIGYVSGSYGYVSSQSASSPLALSIDGNPALYITTGRNVGIGLTTNIGQKLTVNGRIRVSSDGANGGDMAVNDGGLAFSAIQAAPIQFWTSDYTNLRMTITSGGQVGIKTTPSSGWGSAMSVLQVGTGGVLSNWTGANNNLTVGVNFYDNGAGSQLRLYTGAASTIGFSGDVITFSNAASGSAGAAITFNPRMTITSGGNVLLGTTDNTAAYRLNVAVNGGSAYMGVTNQAGGSGDRYLRIGFGTGATVASIQGTRVNVADDVNLALQPDGGNVGIGTADPRLKLTVNGAIGNGLSAYPHNGRLVKAGTTSVTFTITVPYASNWNPAYATIRVAGSRTGLEEQYAAMYFLRLTYYAGSISPVVNNVSGDTGNATVSVSASAPSNSVITITITDGGTSTNYLIADLDASFNTGILSIT